jgi:hypothetical protein
MMRTLKGKLLVGTMGFFSSCDEIGTKNPPVQFQS